MLKRFFVLEWRFCGGRRTYSIIWNCNSDEGFQVTSGTVPDKQSSMTGRNAKNASGFGEVGHGLKYFCQRKFLKQLLGF